MPDSTPPPDFAAEFAARTQGKLDTLRRKDQIPKDHYARMGAFRDDLRARIQPVPGYLVTIEPVVHVEGITTVMLKVNYRLLEPVGDRFNYKCVFSKTENGAYSLYHDEYAFLTVQDCFDLPLTLEEVVRKARIRMTNLLSEAAYAAHYGNPHYENAVYRDALDQYTGLRVLELMLAPPPEAP
jgi:hypothetical protein